MVTDGTGIVKRCHDYFPFGEELGTTNGRPSCYAGADEVTEKFAAKERDAETGLDNFVARYWQIA
jgi:hypothetical protein